MLVFSRKVDLYLGGTKHHGGRREPRVRKMVACGVGAKIILVDNVFIYMAATNRVAKSIGPSLLLCCDVVNLEWYN